MAGLVEGKKDYTDEFKTLVPESITLAQEKGLEESVQFLLAFEKKCRLAGDTVNLKEVCLHMVRLCREREDWSRLNSVLTVISKRRTQHKVAIEGTVKEAYEYLEQCPSVQIKRELATTLKEVVDGKIYVEAESARLHMMLAKICEEHDNDIDAAVDLIQDVHVETYGSISKKEKAEYILEQMRMNLKKKDFIRALIQSRKMNRKTIEDSGFEDVKVSFYNMMVDYYTHEVDAWEISQSYFKIFDTTVTKADAAKCKDALESCVVFLVLSKFDNHVSDMMHRLLLLKEVQENELCKSTLELFTTIEIISYPFAGMAQLTSHACFGKSYAEQSSLDTFQKNFHIRVIQHNLRVVSKYYNRITSAKLGQLLNLEPDALEKHLSEMAQSGDIYLKVDRPKGIISFEQPQSPEAVLSDWSSDMGKLLGLLESTSHLINREMMVHKL
jgi:26S proteasome regulatory subunit N5